MKLLKSIIQILLFITIEISQFCHAHTCSTLTLTESQKSNGFTCLLYENENQLELVNTYDYLLQYATNVDTGFNNKAFRATADPSFEIDVSNDGSDNIGTLFGHSINVSNFTLYSFTTFYAKITGYHTFKISANDAAMVSLMDSYDFYCCNNISNPGDNRLALVLGIFKNYSSIIEYTGSPDDTSEVTLYLTADKPVFMSMSYVNRAGSAWFNITLTDPDNVTFTDLSDYMYNSIPDLSCNDEIDILESASVLSSTTYSTDVVATTINALEVPAQLTKYYVKVPMSAIKSSFVISESSTDIVSSSIVSSVSSTNVVSSVTGSSDASTSVVESSTFSYEVSSTPVSSSMASSEGLSSTVQSLVSDSDAFTSAASSSDVLSSVIVN